MQLKNAVAALAFSILATPVSAQVPDWVNVLIAAAQLPVSANAARSEGVPSDDVRAVIEAMRVKNVPANEAKDVLDEARAAHREHGPVDNFGAFVQSKLDAGLRGRDLAAAIRAEHKARGKGHSGAAKGASDDRDRGKSPAAGQAKGKSPAAGDSKGKSPAARGDTTKGVRGDSGRAARPNQAGRGKRPTDNR